MTTCSTSSNPRSTEREALEVGPATDLWHAEMAILQMRPNDVDSGIGTSEGSRRGGLSLIDYSYVNEAIGRSLHGLYAVERPASRTPAAARLGVRGVEGPVPRSLVAGEIMSSFSMTEPAVGALTETVGDHR